MPTQRTNRVHRNPEGLKANAPTRTVMLLNPSKKGEPLGIKPQKKKRWTEGVNNMKMDVSNIHLDGEEHENVPVYDTCDQVRKKIRTFLSQDGVTQAAFLREVAKTFGNGRKIQSNMLNEFLGKKGPISGNVSSIFYAGYVFFEKIRIRDGKPKTAFREEMEDIWDGVLDWRDQKPGFDRKARHNTKYLCGPGYVPVIDKYGRVTTQRM
ncbi:hypothetical protein V491_01414 [Pseudogymnoascus sp. VKM F-3775]|nr:hypothetical protein V491_01414 [Pseudogymnoascus sp. VKM F-3775]